MADGVDIWTSSCVPHMMQLETMEFDTVVYVDTCVSRSNFLFPVQSAA
jgi:hypothetical protein